MLEEHENQETSLQDLIDLVERDDLPTNEFTIEDKDPMVILGKLNEVIANLQTISASERGTKVYRGTLLLNSLDIEPIENDIADNTTAITALQNGKVDKVTGKQLSTEDFTTAEKNKLAGLNNYDDTQVQADITALETKNAEQDNSIANINNKIYPIGSIYITTSQASPASIYGGTWELIKDRFLLGAGDTYNAGATGGEATHTLTKGEMPYHNHQLLRYLDTGSAYSAGYGAGNHTGILSETASTAFIPSMWTSYVGGDQPHNNMPPYLVVNIWKRLS